MAKPTARKPAMEPREKSGVSGPVKAEMKAMMTPTAAPTPMKGQNLGAVWTTTSMFPEGVAEGTGSAGCCVGSIPSRVLNQRQLGRQIGPQARGADLSGGQRGFPGD